MLSIMQQISSRLQDLVSNQALAGQPDAAQGQIGGSGNGSDSLVPFALPAIEGAHGRERLANARRALVDLPKEWRGKIGGLIEDLEDGEPPAPETLASLEDLIERIRNARQRAKERAVEMTEIAELQRAANESRREARQSTREITRPYLEAERLEAERLAAIRRDAIAQAAIEERARAERLKAEKETRRIMAAQRAEERAEREARRLAAWPRKKVFP
jgi:hypothetical protein